MEEGGREGGREGGACKKDRKDCRTQMSGHWLVTNESRPLVTSLKMLGEKKAHVSLFSLSERDIEIDSVSVLKKALAASPRYPFMYH